MSISIRPRHAGLDPASRFSSAAPAEASGTPGQARGDELAVSFEGSVG